MGAVATGRTLVAPGDWASTSSCTVSDCAESEVGNTISEFRNDADSARRESSLPSLSEGGSSPRAVPHEEGLDDTW